jgi:EsV-1-7 cysteine-rich motif
MTICRICKKKHAIFNYIGMKARFCAEHKTDDMINVKHERCQHPTCKSIASCNVLGLKAKYCAEHKTDDMINVKHKRCQHPKCKSGASYNVLGLKAKYCAEHKTDDMINVKYKRCQHPNCKSGASCNVLGLKAKYCAEHKTDDMINVTYKRCQHPTCKSQPSFNYIGMKARFCAEHKTDDMVNVNDKCCEHPKCKSRASCNVLGLKAKYCAEHKTDDMINVVSKRCVGQEGTCMTLVKCNYRGYCLHCFMHTFPNEPVLRNYKTKEKVVVDRIKSHFPDFVWRHDKVVECGVSRRRPDLLLDVGSHVLIIEIDEDSHESYDCSCENKRLMQLSMDVSRIHFPEIGLPVYRSCACSAPPGYQSGAACAPSSGLSVTVCPLRFISQAQRVPPPVCQW